MTEQQKFSNTDPMLIAKYDDELRKVRGGWREDIITEYVYLPIPDESHNWSSRFRWHDVETDLRGFGKTELDAVFDLFRNALDYEYGDGSEQESILDAAWIGIGGSHPTEQPSVRDAARVLLHFMTDTDEPAQETLIAGTKAMHPNGWELSDRIRFDRGFTAALRSLAQEGGMMIGPFHWTKELTPPEGKSVGGWRRLMRVVWKEKVRLSRGRTIWAYISVALAILAIWGWLV